MSRIKMRALNALRSLPQADCRVDDEATQFHDGHCALDWAPIVPGTLKGIIGPWHVDDDMDGNLVKSDDDTRVGSINYISGHLHIDPGLHYEARFCYYCDVNRIPPPPPFELRLVSTPLVAEVRHVRKNAKIKSIDRLDRPA